GIDVEVDPTCRIRPGEELATARVWEEARKALNATAWTQRQGLLRYAVRSTERRLDPWTQNVEDERTETRRGVSRGSPYVALDANRLAQGGFAHLDAETQVYYAPDATTLLSSWFLDNHCFQVVPVSEAEPGLVGLSFEPIAEGNQIDVRGTLWLDARTAELSRLDFGYTGLPRSMGRIEAGGRVEFDRLATGEWIVPRWRIRMPVVRWPTTNLYSHLTMDPSRRSPVLLAYEEDSGEVLEVVHVRSEELVSSARRFPSEPIPYVPPPVAAAAPREDPADPFPADPLENPSDPIPADPIDVVVEREEPEAELESRSRGESSYVITAEDISEMPLPLGRILERNIPGLRYMVRGSCAMLETRNGVVELVVLDGQRIHETCVLSLIQPDDVERIEFMPSIAASIEYGAVAGGGVLIVETSH
ncbi:MAG: TonB-dependent receptor, partial [Gemmatimonadota bacterium]